MTDTPGRRRSKGGAAPIRYAVIMAGGHGTRFWPRSRRRVPKQLLRIAGRHTLIQATVRRLRPLFPSAHILVVTTPEHAAEVRRQLPGLPPQQVLVEPLRRNTLACVALAAEWIGRRGQEATMCVVPADHVIKNGAAFRTSLAEACAFAERLGVVAMLGVPPTRPDTGYGYVEVGKAVGTGAPGAHWVRQFREKPSLHHAQRYVASGRFLWNAGIFVWRTTVFRAALQRHRPELLQRLHGVWKGSKAERGQRLRRAYRRLPSLSIDVGLMEPLTAERGAAIRIGVLRATFDWNDVGSWVAMPEVWGCDAAGNTSSGRVVAVDATDTIVYAPERLVAVVGLSNLIVVDSADALLVCARERAQDVRQVTDELRRRGWTRHL
jgi:mannose-1-phosphate guanylyltransferase